MAAEYWKMFRAMEELAGQEAVLASVARVSGSTYRSIGARMLILPGGERIGSVSGGCIEGEIAQKGWWWTAQGAYLRCYDTRLEAEGSGSGLACNGSIEVMVERVRSGDANSSLGLLLEIYASRVRSVIATVFRTDADGCMDGRVTVPQRISLGEDGRIGGAMERELREVVLPHMRAALAERVSCRISVESGGATYDVVLEMVESPLQLVICGAGFDAVPLARFAVELGWRAVVCDGRADFARAERFPGAERVVALRAGNFRKDLRSIAHDDRTACVVMTHSHDQDCRLLEYWLPLGLKYVGVLGARSRTEQMLEEVGLPFDAAQVYSPAGLDIGSETPEEIALAIVAEVRACFGNRSGGPLRERAGKIHLNRSGFHFSHAQ